MKELICIVCPKGCHLKVDEENGFAVSGHTCERGEAYGKAELQNPTRVITSTVRLAEGAHRRCPVKTDGPIPKHLIFEAMKTLDAVALRAPVTAGTIVVENVCGTKQNFIVTKNFSST